MKLHLWNIPCFVFFYSFLTSATPQSFKSIEYGGPVHFESSCLTGVAGFHHVKGSFLYTIEATGEAIGKNAFRLRDGALSVVSLDRTPIVGPADDKPRHFEPRSLIFVPHTKTFWVASFLHARGSSRHVHFASPVEIDLAGKIANHAGEIPNFVDSGSASAPSIELGIVAVFPERLDWMVLASHEPRLNDAHYIRVTVLEENNWRGFDIPYQLAYPLEGKSLTLDALLPIDHLTKDCLALEGNTLFHIQLQGESVHGISRLRQAKVPALKKTKLLDLSKESDNKGVRFTGMTTGPSLPRNSLFGPGETVIVGGVDEQNAPVLRAYFIKH